MAQAKMRLLQKELEAAEARASEAEGRLVGMKKASMYFFLRNRVA